MPFTNVTHAAVRLMNYSQMPDSAPWVSWCTPWPRTQLKECSEIERVSLVKDQVSPVTSVCSWRHKSVYLSTVWFSKLTKHCFISVLSWNTLDLACYSVQDHDDNEKGQSSATCVDILPPLPAWGASHIWRTLWATQCDPRPVMTGSWAVTSADHINVGQGSNVTAGVLV